MRPATRSRRTARLATFASALALGVIVAGAATANAASGPDGARRGNGGQGSGAPAKGASNLVDHGGLVLSHSDTYLVFWGSFPSAASDEPLAMETLFSGFPGSSYLGIAQQYMRGAPISNTYHGFRTDLSAPPKTAPKASTLGAEVATAWGTLQPNALYVVFTANTPHISYCAWHDKTTVNGVAIEVAYIPLQPAGCSPYTVSNLQSGNGFSEDSVAAADSAAHEFMEAVTDPQLNAWYDANGQEIADKCNYNYIRLVTLGHTKWQIQSEWSNALSACTE